MPRTTNLSKAPRPKTQTVPKEQGFARVPSPAKRDEVAELPPRRPGASKPAAPPRHGAPQQPARAAVAPTAVPVGFTPKMLIGIVGTSMSMLAAAFGAERDKEEEAALAECMAAVANKYPMAKYAEEVALGAILVTIVGRMAMQGKEARARAKSPAGSGDRTEGDGQKLAA